MSTLRVPGFKLILVAPVVAAVAVLGGSQVRAETTKTPGIEVGDRLLMMESAVGVSNGDLIFNAPEEDRPGLQRLNLMTKTVRRIVAHDFAAAHIPLAAVGGGSVVYVKSSFARGGNGYERSADRVFVSDTWGRNRRIIHREFQKQSERVSGGDCGSEIAALKLLPRKRFQIVVTTFGRSTVSGGCAPSRTRPKSNRVKRIMRFTYSGRRILNRKFSLRSDIRDHATDFDFSGDGRYLLRPRSERIEIIDLHTGRTRDLKMIGGNGRVRVVAGPNRTALAVYRARLRSGRNAYRLRLYRDFLRSNRSRIIGTSTDVWSATPTWCGNQLLVYGDDPPRSVHQFNVAAKKSLLEVLPEDEWLEAIACNSREAMLITGLRRMDYFAEPMAVRPKPLRPTESPRASRSAVR